MHFRRMKLSEHVPEVKLKITLHITSDQWLIQPYSLQSPSVLFFSSTSLPPPSDKAKLTGPPDFELKDSEKEKEKAKAKAKD